MACSPATPAPSTSTFAGGIVPAAVISIGKNFGSASAASSTALYPETVACDESASMLCAREMRGMSSIENEVMLRSASLRENSGCTSGWRNAMSDDPCGMSGISSSSGRWTLSVNPALA